MLKNLRNFSMFEVHAVACSKPKGKLGLERGREALSLQAQ
jgi:hypothetical protein